MSGNQTPIAGQEDGPRVTPAQAQALLRQIPTEELEAAVGECQRELGVRMRCFDRWVQEGRLSKIDARDRLTRMKIACEIIQLAIDSRMAE